MIRIDVGNVLMFLLMSFLHRKKIKSSTLFSVFSQFLRSTDMLTASTVDGLLGVTSLFCLCFFLSLSRSLVLSLLTHTHLKGHQQD